MLSDHNIYSSSTVHCIIHCTLRISFDDNNPTYGLPKATIGYFESYRNLLRPFDPYENNARYLTISGYVACLVHCGTKK